MFGPGLRHSYYSSWELKIRVLIEKEGLLRLIDTKLDEKVRAMITFALEDSQLIHVRNDALKFHC